MPPLTFLFPNFQFITTTYSPAVISSIKNAVVFDLISKETGREEVLVVVESLILLVRGT